SVWRCWLARAPSPLGTAGSRRDGEPVAPRGGVLRQRAVARAGVGRQNVAEVLPREPGRKAREGGVVELDQRPVLRGGRAAEGVRRAGHLRSSLPPGTGAAGAGGRVERTERRSRRRVDAAGAGVRVAAELDRRQVGLERGAAVVLPVRLRARE